MAADKPFIKRPEQIDVDRATEIVRKFQESKPKTEEGVELTVKPSSFLRFMPFIGPQLTKQKMMKQQGLKPEEFGEVDIEKEVLKVEEDEKTKDFAAELDRAFKSGTAKTVQAIGSFITSGIDVALDTDTNKALDKAIKNYINIHGEPETFAGELTEIATQFGIPGVATFKIIGNAGKLKKIKNLNQFIQNKVGKIKNKFIRSTTAGATNVARYSGQGALSLGIADALVSDPGRETFFTEKVSEENKSGKDLAVARLINKLKFAQEGALIGGGIPLAGKGLQLGFKYGLFPAAKTVGSIGAKTINAAVVRPTTFLLSKDPYVLPSLAKGAQINAKFIG